jgi:integrase
MIALESEGKANSTIGTYKRHLSNLFSWAETHCINDRAQPIQHWLKGNPFFGVGTEGYGAKKRSYEALSEEQLHHLFSLDMPEDHRLLLSILITTGMRLDEVALLEWSQYKKDRNGLRYFDLSLGAIVKNDKFSARTVAIPDCLTLPPASQGRLFNFPVNADGKSSKWASKELNETYFHVIRMNKEDDRKVVHSLRHNLTGMMQNLTDPPAPDNHMDWITGHSMEGDKTASERKRTYASDVDVKVKYDIVNRIKHPWLERPNT